MCQQMDVPYLGSVPLDGRVAAAGDQGMPLAQLQPDGPVASVAEPSDVSNCQTMNKMNCEVAGSMQLAVLADFMLGVVNSFGENSVRFYIVLL